MEFCGIRLVWDADGTQTADTERQQTKRNFELGTPVAMPLQPMVVTVSPWSSSHGYLLPVCNVCIDRTPQRQLHVVAQSILR